MGAENPFAQGDALDAFQFVPSVRAVRHLRLVPGKDLVEPVLWRPCEASHLEGAKRFKPWSMMSRNRSAAWSGPCVS